LQRPESALQTWAAVSSGRGPKKEVKHNLNGEADIAQCHLAPLQPVNAAAPGARCRRCVQGRLFAHRVCVCGRPTGRGTKPGIRLTVSGQVSAHMSGPGRNCPVPTENWLRPSAACLRGTCLYHRASVPPWPELAQTFPSGAAPRHAHPRVAALLLRLACHSGPCSLLLPLQSNNNTTILTT
jgi:hypothetical protein